MLRGRAAGHRITALSDRYAQPPAYHALTAGFLARAIDLAGAARPGRARRALGSPSALWAYQSPDGDLAYMGRSQGQAWALALRQAGRGARRRPRLRRPGAGLPRRRRPRGPAARRAPSRRPERDADRALGERAGDDPRARRLRWRRRLQRAHADGARVGAEGHAAGAPAACADAIMSERKRAEAVLPFETGTFAVLRRGRVWMAVKRVEPGRRPARGLRAPRAQVPRRRTAAGPTSCPRRRGSPARRRTFGPALIPRSGSSRSRRAPHLKARRGRITIDGGWVTPTGEVDPARDLQVDPDQARGPHGRPDPPARHDPHHDRCSPAGPPPGADRHRPRRRRAGGTPTVAVRARSPRRARSTPGGPTSRSARAAGSSRCASRHRA